jgi:hypothetical protein
MDGPHEISNEDAATGTIAIQANETPSDVAAWRADSEKLLEHKRYIDEYVRDPFDYVQLDHSRVDAELLRDGIEPAVFWNIWRLTPPVYRARLEV